MTGRPRFLAIAIAICLAAGALRLPGLSTDLWLDEIWSVALAGTLTSIGGVFTAHHEINHHVNTAWLFLVGPDAAAWQYRLLSFVAGIATVFVAGLIGRRRSLATAVITMLLVAVSYELVLFSSEARGYSMVGLCTLLTYYIVDRHLERPSWTTTLGYWLTAIVGILSQPIFAGVLAAACVWSAISLWQTRASAGFSHAASRWVQLQAVPVAAFLALYVGDLRLVNVGGGTATSVMGTYAGSFAWALGTPMQSGPIEIVFVVLGLAVLGVGVWSVGRANARPSFFITAIVVFPLLLVFARGSEYVYTRHFLPGATLLVVLLGDLLGAWWQSGRLTMKGVVAALVVGFGATNAAHLADLARHGRGQHQRAVWYMADNTKGDAIIVGGDQDFRIGTELIYYMPRVLGSRPWRYVTQDQWPPGGPEWIVIQSESFQKPTAVDDYTDPSGMRYTLALDLPTAPLSGLHWMLYHNHAMR